MVLQDPAWSTSGHNRDSVLSRPAAVFDQELPLYKFSQGLGYSVAPFSHPLDTAHEGKATRWRAEKSMQLWWGK